MAEYRQHSLFRKHTLDSAVESLWNFYKSHFAPLFIISFIFSSAITWLSLSIDTDALMEMAISQDVEALQAFFRSYLRMMIPVVLISIYGMVYLSLFVYRSPAGRINYVALTGESFRYLITFLIICILFVPLATLTFVAGLIVFLIGVLFSVVWLTALFAFFLPLLINEGNDITNTLIRSFRLLHSYFWPNMGWTTVVILMVLIISIIISGLSMIPFAGSLLKTMANPEETAHLLEMVRNPVYVVFSSALNALLMPVFPIFTFILYFNAKAREEEFTPEV